MSLDSGTVVIPGRGTVLIADVDTPPPNFDQFAIEDPTTYTNWAISHTSKENTFAFEKDGGDSEQKGSWETSGLRSSKEPTAVSWTTGKLQIDKEHLELAFGAGTNEWDPQTKSYKVRQFNSTAKAVCVIFMDANGSRGGWYMPNNEISIGDMPDIDAEEFLEIQLSGQILASPTTGVKVQAFTIRPYTSKD